MLPESAVVRDEGNSSDPPTFRESDFNRSSDVGSWAKRKRVSTSIFIRLFYAHDRRLVKLGVARAACALLRKVRKKFPLKR